MSQATAGCIAARSRHVPVPCALWPHLPPPPPQCLVTAPWPVSPPALAPSSTAQCDRADSLARPCSLPISRPQCAVTGGLPWGRGGGRGDLDPAPPAPAACMLSAQVLRQYSINLSEEEFFHILEYYDKSLSAKISYNDFLRAFLQ